MSSFFAVSTLTKPTSYLNLDNIISSDTEISPVQKKDKINIFSYIGILLLCLFILIVWTVQR